MTFFEVDGYTFADPVEWHAGSVEVIHGLASSGVNLPSTSPDLVAPPTSNTPVAHDSSTLGFAQFIRSAGSVFPQETGGLQCAWTHARLGHNTASTMLQWGAGVCQTPVAGLGNSSAHGAGYSGESDPHSLIFPSGVQADAWVGGYYLYPTNIFSAWTSPWFNYPGGSNDPVLVAEYEAAIAATDPGIPGAIVQDEGFGPIFVGYQLAPDEVIAGGNSGTVFWGYNSRGWALTAPTDDPADLTWEGPGSPEADMLADYSGGVSGWVDPKPEWVPGWDLENDTFIAPDVPLIPFNVYHDFHTRTREISPDVYAILLNELPGTSEMPDGFSVSVGAQRANQGLAVKALWRPPRFRWGLPYVPVTRQLPRSGDARGLSAGTRGFPVTTAGRIVSGDQ